MAEINMAKYGLINQFAAYAQSNKEKYLVGRILSQERGMYRIISERGEQLAEVSGKMRYCAERAMDYPAVGDFVTINKEELSGTAMIQAVLPRKSVFLRKAAGTGCSEQVVVANIDTVFICMSLNNDFNIRRLERYLSVAWDSGAIPVIVLTKADLCEDVDRYLHAVQEVAVGTDIVVTSGTIENGYEDLFPYMKEGKTIALLGSSGVGKSTLINRFLGEERLLTGGIRNDDKGKHTTTRRELFLLKNGGMIIDTPGMRELGLFDVAEGLTRSFKDVEELATMCRFHNCSHKSEPGCAIKEAIANGELSMERWNSYLKLQTENAYAENSRSYLEEKKRKFKSIAMSKRK